MLFTVSVMSLLYVRINDDDDDDECVNLAYRVTVITCPRRQWSCAAVFSAGNQGVLLRHRGRT